MTLIRVDARALRLEVDGLSMPCVIGKGGFLPAVDKREGDGATPLGRWPVRGVLLRPDRPAAVVAPLALPWRWIGPDDGWCDDAGDAAYNRPVRLPYGAGHERLNRDDQAYDAIVVLGHNDAPPVAGRGSAIFFHQWVLRDGVPGATEGCVAIAPEDMRRVLPMLSAGSVMEIVGL